MASRFSRDDGFGRSTRFYKIDEETSYPSVTSILSVVAKPALVNWAANRERDMVLEAAAQLWGDVPTSPKMTNAAYIATLQGRLGKVKAYKKDLEKAADIGSQAHAVIEWELRRELLQESGPRPKIGDKAEWSVMAWEDWRHSVNLAPLAIEQTVWSATYGYAGSLDLLCELDTPDGRRRVVVDWKTGKAIYKEAKLQNAAYVQAVCEMGHARLGDVSGLIVRLPKVETDPKFETLEIPRADQPRLLATFLVVKALWEWVEQEEKRPRPVSPVVEAPTSPAPSAAPVRCKKHHDVDLGGDTDSCWKCAAERQEREEGAA